MPPSPPPDPGTLRQLARLAANTADEVNRVRLALQEAVGRAFDALAGLNADALGAYLGATMPLVQAAAEQVAVIIEAQMATALELSGYPAAADALTLADVSALRGDDLDAFRVRSRPVTFLRVQVANGVDYAQAFALARSRAVAQASMDAILAQRAAMAHHVAEARAEGVPVHGTRRVLSGASCRFCAVASTQRYHVAELMPLHHHCDCGVAPIIGGFDPGRVINAELLAKLKEQGGKYWQKRGFVDSAGEPMDPEKFVRDHRVRTENHGEHGATIAGMLEP